MLYGIYAVVACVGIIVPDDIRASVSECDIQQHIIIRIIPISCVIICACFLSGCEHIQQAPGKF